MYLKMSTLHLYPNPSTSFGLLREGGGVVADPWILQPGVGSLRGFWGLEIEAPSHIPYIL